MINSQHFEDQEALDEESEEIIKYFQNKLKKS
jgi:hypothetical protein